jgi:cupin 2 domain-containing protein
MNLFGLPERLPQEEWLETLLKRENIRVERIVSTGQSSLPGFWYEQTEDEWVAVLQGNAALEWTDGTMQELTAGDYLLIPAGKKHRVARTSTQPPCIWLAIFMSPA